MLVGELGFTGKLQVREGFGRIILLTKDSLVFNQILTLENFIIISRVIDTEVLGLRIIQLMETSGITTIEEVISERDKRILLGVGEISVDFFKLRVHVRN